MKKYALIGENISYSLSPLIHEAIYEKMGFSGNYELISVSKDELGELCTRLKSEYSGFNVTKPHKQNIVEFLEFADGKSVNTVSVKNGVMRGTTTDGYGFTRDLKLNFGEVSGKALVLGAGGVSRVIVAELKNMGMDVYVYNRTRETGEALARETGVKYAEREDVCPDLLVNCTSFGLHKGENPVLDAHGNVAVNAQNLKWVYDTIYSPPVTDLLKTFPSAKNVNGLGMLILQAIEADRIMCDFDIDEQTEWRLYREIKEKCSF